MKNTNCTLRGALLCALALSCVPAHAVLQDEIQVYDDSINKPGEFGLELHVNLSPSARGTPDYPGEFLSVHGLRTTFEPSYGLSEHFELGMYLPFDRLADGSEHFAGPRVRLKWIGQQGSPGNPWYYGLNFELGKVHQEFDYGEASLETRPILGWRKDGWAVTFNPVISAPLTPGRRTGGPDFNPSLKVAREVGTGLAAGFEYYAELGQFSHFDPYSQQSHTLFLALDVDRAPLVCNLAVGRGLTTAADRWTVKAIFELPI